MNEHCLPYPARLGRALCLGCALFAATSATGANFWLSTTGDPNIGSAPPANSGSVPQISRPIATPTGSVYIWARPDAGKTLANWSLRLISTNSSVLTFTGSSVEAFNVLDPLSPNTVRWEYVGEPSGSSTSVGDIRGFSLFGLGTDRTGVGIGPQSTGSPYEDPLYDSVNNSWLLAKVDYSLTGLLQQTDLYLQIGSDGLNNFTATPSDPNNFMEDSSLTSAVFGATSDEPLDASSERLVNSDTPDATVTAVTAIHNANFDGDGDVDGIDFLIWQRRAGAPGGPSMGDANNDGMVNGLDLAIWEQQYAGPPPLQAVQVVPEPAAVMLALPIGILIGCRRRRVGSGSWNRRRTSP